MDYEFETTTGEIIKAHSAPYSSAQIDELLGRVLNEDVGGGVFWAEYGVTTYQEVLSAYTDGKLCALRKNSIYDQDYSLTFVLAEKNEYGFYFYSIFSHWSDNCIVEWVSLEDSNQWSVGHFLLEHSALKVDTISPEDSIAQYPSSPAVQAYVEANKEVFWAAYGTSTSAEVDAAIDAGKLVCTQYGGLTYVLYYSSAASPRVHRFFSGMWLDTGSRLGINHELELNNNTWSEIETAYQSADNRADSVDADTPKYKYPSVGAVRDYVAAKLEPVSAAADKAEDYALGAYVTPTASGSIASFDDGADGLPVKSLVVNIEPVQAGTGEPSPDNVRPISGRTGVNVQRTGKNLLGLKNMSASIRGVTIDVVDGLIILNGTATGTTTEYNLDMLSVPLMGEYNVNYKIVSGSWSNYLDNATMLRFRGIGIGSGDEVRLRENLTELNIQLTNGLYRASVFVHTGATYNNLTLAPQLEVGSTATAYEPYQGDTYDISFPDEAGTVYSGTLDVTTGLLTIVNFALVTFNGEEEFTAQPTTSNSYTQIFACDEPKINNKRAFNQVRNLIRSNMFKATATTSFAGLRQNTFYWADATGAWRFGWGSPGATVEEFKAFLSANPLEILVPIAPSRVTYQLTPTEVNTLLGVNNICADTGGVEVSYRADPTKIYEKVMNAMLTMTGGN